jgi:hypothetical protein
MLKAVAKVATLGKAIRRVGLFLTAVGLGLDVKAKGDVAGIVNSGINAIAVFHDKLLILCNGARFCCE